MEILKIFTLVIALAVFVFTGLVIREDYENTQKWATVLFCLSMAALIVIRW